MSRRKYAPTVTPSDLAPARDTGGIMDKVGNARGKLGAVRPATPEEYTQAGLLAADYATDVHPAGTPEADQLAAELLAMLGVLDDRRLYRVRRVRREAGHA